jgi:hypothetical protein
LLLRRLTRVDSIQPGPGRGQQLIDGHGVTSPAEPVATTRGSTLPS